MTAEDVATYCIFISNNASYSTCLNCNGKRCRNAIINATKLYRIMYLTELIYYSVFGTQMLNEKINCAGHGIIYYDVKTNIHREKIQYPSGKRIEQACSALSDEVKELIRITYNILGKQSCETLISLCYSTEPYATSIDRHYMCIDRRLFKFNKQLHEEYINMKGDC